MSITSKTKLAVLGAGPGGYAAAFLAADLGLEVTLIDERPYPGGVCLFEGCIPSKTLLHAARLIDEARHGRIMGIEFGEPRVDLNRLRDFKDVVIARLTSGLGELGKKRSVRFLQGTARFTGPRTLAVETYDADEETTTDEELIFEQAIIATGSVPVELPGLPKNPALVWDARAALELREIPKRLLVIGGGYIGLEMSTVYAGLGSRVTVLEMTPGLLPGADRDLVAPLAGRLSKKLEAVLLNARFQEVREKGDGLVVTFAGPDVPTGEEFYDKIIVSVGRKPNTTGLGLENTRVEFDERGFIRVDEARRTAEPGLYAIGDIAGQPMLAHKASHEGKVAAESVAGKRVAFEPRAIPGVVFTDPEIAWCGLTQTEAQAQNRNVKVVRFPWSASGRALTLDRTEGVTKLIIDPDTERILGVGITGPGAGDMIAEGALAIEMGAVASDLKLTIHPHPTLSETLMEAADLFYGECTHLFRPASNRR